MKTRTARMKLGLVTLALGLCVAAQAAAPVITNMALIPAGSFTMGDRLDRNPKFFQKIYVSAFYVDKYEVTKALWDEVYQWATNHGYSFRYEARGKASNHPVQAMTWYDAVKWCNARSEKEGRVPAYYTSAEQTSVYRSGQVDVQNVWVKWDTGYRLPTEAEWEKAARGGASGHRFPWSDTDNITHSRENYNSSTKYNSGTKDVYDTSSTRGYHPTFATNGTPYTSPVGYFAPNGYGLYDMAGNVQEWCWDWYDRYSRGSKADPRGPVSCSYLISLSGSDPVSAGRVLRGGSWDSDAFYCRTAWREHSNPGASFTAAGFRSVLPPGQ